MYLSSPIYTPTRRLVMEISICRAYLFAGDLVVIQLRLQRRHVASDLAEHLFPTCGGKVGVDKHTYGVYI